MCSRDRGARDVAEIARRMLASGRPWISTTGLGGVSVLRAGISNLRTSADEVAADDVAALIAVRHAR